MKLRDLTSLAHKLPDVEISSLSCDSRKVGPGSLFAALPGSTVDGHQYIDGAVKAGAAAILARPGTTAPVPVIESEEPRLTLAQIAMRFYPAQPDVIVGVTGTNGKSSVVRFLSQIWSQLGHRAGSLGTLGATAPGYDYALRHTTPDPIELHQVIETMARVGTTHLAMEISSHGLAQYRADGVRLAAAGFTNITQDHLDYHKDFDDYFEAKARLFTDLLPIGAPAVINVDGPGAPRMADVVEAAGREVIRVGRGGDAVTLLSCAPAANGLSVQVSTAGGSVRDLSLPLIGSFQADNALVAAGLAIALGGDPADVLRALETLTAAPGRMELAGTKQFTDGRTAHGYVDYAHTPDAITTALSAIRPHAEGQVHVIIGAGGDRDTAKRPLMGQAAAAGADHVIITDDNPRSEEPGTIRMAVAEGAPAALIVPGRAEAIGVAAGRLAPGDVLLVAGKGHEQGQTIDGVTYPFDDVAIVREALVEASA